MNNEILKSAGIDYDFGVKRFVGRANLYEKALTKFSKDGTFSRVCEAYAANDKEALFATAHEFKGMCGNIGLTSLYEGADVIVRLLRSGDFSEQQLSEAFDMLAGRYNTIRDAVIASMEEAL